MKAPTLWHALDRAAARTPDAVALIADGERIHYARLRDDAAALAAGLTHLRIARGDCVAIWLPNRPLWVALAYACARIGAVAMAVNTRFKSGELGDILGRSGAKLLVYEPGFRGIDFTAIFEGVERAALADLKAVVCASDSAPDRINGVRALTVASLLARAGEAPATGASEDACVMFTTSGTTSRPKLVMHTQRSIARHADITAHALGYDAPGSVIHVVTPLCGVSGFGMPFAAIAARAPCVLMPSFDARESLDLMRAHRVTHVHANHEIIRRWLDALHGDERLTSLKAVNCGSGIGGVRERAAARGIPLQSIYGSSELQARFSRQHPDSPPERALQAGGFPLAQEAQVRAVDPDSGRVLPHGEKGELQMRAPSQMQGYFGDAQASARGFAEDGFVRSGDCGYTRDDGSFVFEARMGDVLKLSGFMVSPAEIESYVMRYPGVEQCQVVGAQTPQGLRAFAFVRGAVSLEESAVLRHCREHMAGYKVPVRIVRLDAFPTTAGANAPKVQKAALRETAQAMLRAGEA